MNYENIIGITYAFSTDIFRAEEKAEPDFIFARLPPWWNGPNVVGRSHMVREYVPFKEERKP